jgi:hypothetical protein
MQHRQQDNGGAYPFVSPSSCAFRTWRSMLIRMLENKLDNPMRCAEAGRGREADV